MIASRIDAGCAERLVGTRQFTADVDTDVVAGDIARATVEGDGCRMRATMLITSGHANAGDRAVVTGRASASDHGLFIQDATVLSTAPADVLLRARAAAGRRIDRLIR